MPKKRRRARKTDPLAGRRHPPFGATEAQGNRNQRERDYKNQIFALEQRVEALTREIDKQDKEINELQRKLVYAEPTKAQREALRAVSGSSIILAIQTEIFDSVCELARWSLLLDGKVVKGQNGANVIEYVQRIHANPEPEQIAWGAGERAKEHRAEGKR
jgi:predicted RNase H-like nuclease (RuvC/YqgF family)